MSGFTNVEEILGDLPPLSETNLAVLCRLFARVVSSTETVRDFWRMLLICFNTPLPSTNYDEVDKPERLDAFRAVMKDVCTRRGLSYREDTAGNILIEISTTITFPRSEGQILFPRSYG